MNEAVKRVKCANNADNLIIYLILSPTHLSVMDRHLCLFPFRVLTPGQLL